MIYMKDKYLFIKYSTYYLGMEALPPYLALLKPKYQKIFFSFAGMQQASTVYIDTNNHQYV